MLFYDEISIECWCGDKSLNLENWNTAIKAITVILFPAHGSLLFLYVAATY